MKISDLQFEMELAGVDKAEIAEILQPYNNKTINLTLIDDELEKRGFPVFLTSITTFMTMKKMMIGMMTTKP